MLFYHLIVLDASGSMTCIRQNALSGCNETIQSIVSLQQKANGEHQHFLSLVTFNSDEVTNVIYDKKPIEQVKELTSENYVPTGCTPLYDSLGLSMNTLSSTLDKSQQHSVLVTVITDGLENSSKLFNAEQIRRQVEEYKQSGWTFAFIGANIDEVTEADKLGIQNSLHFDQTGKGTAKMFAHYRESVMDYCEAEVEAACGNAAPEEVKARRQFRFFK